MTQFLDIIPIDRSSPSSSSLRNSDTKKLTLNLLFKLHLYTFSKSPWTIGLSYRIWFRVTTLTSSLTFSLLFFHLQRPCVSGSTTRNTSYDQNNNRTCITFRWLLKIQCSLTFLLIPLLPFPHSTSLNIKDVSPKSPKRWESW